MTSYDMNSVRSLPVKDRLQALVKYGRENAVNALGRLQKEQPRDYLPEARQIRFAAPAQGGFEMKMGRDTFTVHHHALSQLSEKTGIPYKYVQTLVDDHQGDLLADNFNRRLPQDNTKYLVRVVNGETRGVLTDKYRRLDTVPILDNFLTKSKEFGAVPIHAKCMDTQVMVSMAMPTVVEPYPGEFMLYGLCFRNSDYGDGAISLKAWLMRLLCINGMVGEEGFRQIHLGARIDNIGFSQKTYELDTATMASAVGDVVQAVLAPEAVKLRLDKIRDAHEKKVNAEGAITDMQKTGKITKGEAHEIKQLFSSAEIELLPPGNSAWRLSNAISLFAQNVDDHRSIELETLAGEVVGLVKKAA